MIKVHYQLPLAVRLVLFYVVGGIIYFKSPFKRFLEEINNSSLFLLFYFSNICISTPTYTYLVYDTL